MKTFLLFVCCMLTVGCAPSFAKEYFVDWNGDAEQVTYAYVTHNVPAAAVKINANQHCISQGAERAVFKEERQAAYSFVTEVTFTCYYGKQPNEEAKPQ